MQLTNTFTVSLPIEEAWKTFLDLERVASCLPGAAITGVDGGQYHGAVKIKVGPISAQYRGTAAFVETDESAHRAVVAARAQDVGGQGNAEATIAATLTPHGDGTRVQVDMDLSLSGRVAQFGRGVISDVTGKLLNQFSKNLEAEINGGSLAWSPASADHATNPVGTTPKGPTGQRVSIDDVEPLDVMGSMGGVVAKYALPALGGVAVLAIGALLMGRRPRATRFEPGLTGSSPVTVYVTLPGACRSELLSTTATGGRTS